MHFQLSYGVRFSGARSLFEVTLDFERSSDRAHRGFEDDENRVTSGIDDPAAASARDLAKYISSLVQRGDRGLLVIRHES